MYVHLTVCDWKQNRDVNSLVIIQFDGNRILRLIERNEKIVEKRCAVINNNYNNKCDIFQIRCDAISDDGYC